MAGMLAPPKLTKPAGHSKAKLTADSFGTPENLFILLCVQIVAIFFTEIPLKCMIVNIFGWIFSFAMHCRDGGKTWVF